MTDDRRRKPQNNRRRSGSTSESEDSLHGRIAGALDEALPPGWLHQCVENGGGRGAVEAARLKARGQQPGFPDHLVLPPVGWPCLFLEIKRPRPARSKTSNDQAEMYQQLRDAGHHVAVVRSRDEVEAPLTALGAPLVINLQTAETRAQLRRKNERRRSRSRGGRPSRRRAA